LYILDEIDAAMDASNTQYIGQFIQKAFPKKAQFVIVSLKNELFSNANRIYKATLVNRVSQVTKEK
jgi:structural maintenance of chromosome 2